MVFWPIPKFVKKRFIVWPYEETHTIQVLALHCLAVFGFRVKRTLLDDSAKTLLKFKAHHLGRHQKDETERTKMKKWIFVGIHVRRTDHLAYEKKFGLKSLDPSYYLNAMQMFRKKFKNSSKNKRLLFVLVGDDVG